jgi:mannose-6-phosphate isomerase-like protein (cupin superfamily)
MTWVVTWAVAWSTTKARAKIMHVACYQQGYFASTISKSYVQENREVIIRPLPIFRRNRFFKSLFQANRKSMDIINLSACTTFITKDGSQIRELLSHRNSSIRKQSLAEAIVPIGAITQRHHHPKTEEIYFILEGQGEMLMGDETHPVGPGDAIAIPPGSEHAIKNTGAVPLRFLCCCVPGYEHEDTVIAE